MWFSAPDISLQKNAFRVIEAARNAGVRKIVVTHPEWWLVGMSLEDQIRLVKDYGVILEHCFAQPTRPVVNIRATFRCKPGCDQSLRLQKCHGQHRRRPGRKSCIGKIALCTVSSDTWQTIGIPQDEIHYMTHTIQAGLLGLDDFKISSFRGITLCLVF